jgi:Ni/Fe-hydrogenase subunit HybB-like protein
MSGEGVSCLTVVSLLRYVVLVTGWSVGGLILTGEIEVLGEKHYTALVVDV